MGTREAEPGGFFKVVESMVTKMSKKHMEKDPHYVESKLRELVAPELVVEEVQ